MAHAQTEIATEHASKYLQQLCKHWAHKMAVEFTPTEGLVPFSAGAQCKLRAEQEKLLVSIDAQDETTCMRLGGVVVDHLKRFAFREQLAEPIWTAS